MESGAQNQLKRADALARDGRVREAVALYEQVADQRCEQGDALVAVALYRQSLMLLARHAPDPERQTRLSRKWVDAYTPLRIDGNGFEADGFQTAFRLAATAVQGAPAGARSHRALCVRCGTAKAAAWLRCRECGFLPELRRDIATSLLMSELTRSPEQLSELAERIRSGEGNGVPPDIADAFVETLFQGYDRRDIAGLAPVHAPGTVAVVVADDRRAGAMVEVGSTSDAVAGKAAFEQLGEAACLCVLGGTEIDSLDEEPCVDGPGLLGGRRRALERRLGERIEFGRWRRVGVQDHGVVASSTVGHTVRVVAGPGGVQRAGNALAALVALRTAPTASAKQEVLDLAAQIADHIAMVGPECIDDESELALSDDMKLVRQPFWCAPYVTVAEALSVVAAEVGSEIVVTSFARLCRPAIRDDGPDTFPLEMAKRVG